MTDITNDADVLAQLAHIGWGGFLTLLLAQWMPHWGAGLSVIGLALVKEALESLGWAPWEPRQSWGSSAIDFAFWCVGVALACV